MVFYKLKNGDKIKLIHTLIKDGSFTWGMDYHMFYLRKTHKILFDNTNFIKNIINFNDNNHTRKLRITNYLSIKIFHILKGDEVDIVKLTFSFNDILSGYDNEFNNRDYLNIKIKKININPSTTFNSYELQIS